VTGSLVTHGFGRALPLWHSCPGQVEAHDLSAACNFEPETAAVVLTLRHTTHGRFVRLLTAGGLGWISADLVNVL
jgi:hypothetical protein